jgi:hypothetical protein
MDDDETITREIALAACRRLRISPGYLNFLPNLPVP